MIATTRYCAAVKAVGPDPLSDPDKLAQLEPEPRGPAPLDLAARRAAHNDLYNVIAGAITDAQKNGDVLSVHKLNFQLRELGDDNDYTYYQMRYHLRRLGFRFGRITRTIRSGRTKPYVVSWLRSYCTRRVARFNSRSPAVVDVFLDECWLWADAGGMYTWHAGDNHWPKVPSAVVVARTPAVHGVGKLSIIERGVD
jgi:hypothetical protein